MLKIYFVMLDVLRDVKPMLGEIEKHDRDLGRQMRRAATSVVLNIAEGSGSTNGMRRQRYETALGSARETRACLEASEALGYVDRIDPKSKAGLAHVINVLFSVV
jgi:four helix bundle protein